MRRRDGYWQRFRRFHSNHPLKGNKNLQITTQSFTKAGKAKTDEDGKTGEERYCERLRERGTLSTTTNSASQAKSTCIKWATYNNPYRRAIIPPRHNTAAP